VAWSDRIGGKRWLSSAAAGAKPPSISSNPAMELRVVGGPAKGHRNLGANRAGAAADWLGGVMG
jgi:hypothetical protein